MAESLTTRFGLKRWTADTDTPERADFDTAHLNLETNAAGWLPPDTLAARPAAAAANARFFFRASDTEQFFYSTGTEWIEIPSAADISGESDSSVAAHEAASDPHTGYQRESLHTKALHDGLALDHGSLSGKGDDDHTQYSLVSGARAFTGTVSGVTPTSSSHLATKGYADGILPAGTIAFTGRSTAPSGWLLCDGGEVSRSTYSALFSAIGTTFGSGNGSTTFDLPDMRQRFPMGKASSGTGSSLGSTGGSIDHSHSNPSTSSTGSHTHTQSSTGSAGSHGHSDTFAVGGETSGDGSGPNPNIAGDGHRHALTGSVSTNGSHTHSNPTTASSGSHSHSQGDTGVSNPPFIALNAIIKT